MYHSSWMKITTTEKAGYQSDQGITKTSIVSMVETSERNIKQQRAKSSASMSWSQEIEIRNWNSLEIHCLA